MPPSTHIINRQVFEFECRESEHAFQLQRKMDHVVQDKISRAINRVCNQLTTEDGDIQIPKLEVDLGAIPFENLEDEIAAYFEKYFFEKLSEKIVNQRDRTIAHVEKKHFSLQTLQHFLLTGQLPWYAGKQGVSYVAELLDEILTTEDETFQKVILLNISNRQFLERFIATVELHQVEKILVKSGIAPAILLELEEEIIVTVKFIQEAIERINKTTSVYTQQENSKIIEKKINEWLENVVWNKIAIVRKLAFGILLRMIATEARIEKDEFIIHLKQFITQEFKLDVVVVEKELEQKEIIHTQLIPKVQKTQEKIQEKTKAYREELKDEAEVDQKTKFYISNSGLIILAQYLPAFFNVLGLLEDGAFTNKENQIKAVFLLHYICTGEEKVPEYILPLNKLLCGLALEEPLPSFVALTDEEKIECMELLQEVINNWNRLGASSAESLREAFLNREGILWFEDVQGWKLQVERRGYDILLDSLPWSFKQIKLSWMEHLINTEW